MLHIEFEILMKNVKSIFQDKNQQAKAKTKIQARYIKDLLKRLEETEEKLARANIKLMNHGFERMMTIAEKVAELVDSMGFNKTSEWKCLNIVHENGASSVYIDLELKSTFFKNLLVDLEGESLAVFFSYENDRVLLQMLRIFNRPITEEEMLLLKKENEEEAGFNV